jgi:hypothetical protein
MQEQAEAQKRAKAASGFGGFRVNDWLRQQGGFQASGAPPPKSSGRYSEPSGPIIDAEWSPVDDKK